MAVRLLVCACLLFGVSAADVYSEAGFKKAYDAYVLDLLDAAAVKSANANIVGSAIPTETVEKELHRWYHDVDTAEQAEANAVMDKAHVAKPAAAFQTSSCLADITAAQVKTAGQATKPTWDEQYKVYNKILAEKVGVATKGTPKWETEDVKAWSCLNALSGAQKELAINSLTAKLFGVFKETAGTEVKKATDLHLVSQFVSGTLAANPGIDAANGKDTQPMYTQADAGLRREMMQYMVTELNKKATAV